MGRGREGENRIGAQPQIRQMEFLVFRHLQSHWGEGSKETAGSVNHLTPGNNMDGTRQKKAEEGTEGRAL